MLEQVIENLKLCKGRLPAVAEDSGIPFGTLRKIANGMTKNPKFESVQQLHDYFESKPICKECGQRIYWLVDSSTLNDKATK